jgi:hypothetical protein
MSIFGDLAGPGMTHEPGTRPHVDILTSKFFAVSLDTFQRFSLVKLYQLFVSSTLRQFQVISYRFCSNRVLAHAIVKVRSTHFQDIIFYTYT